jgi:hypothetical protein
MEWVTRNRLVTRYYVILITTKLWVINVFILRLTINFSLATSYFLLNFTTRFFKLRIECFDPKNVKE